MADLIKIKGGSGDIPTLQDKELAYKKDSKELYIGTASGNVRLCGADDVSAINARIDAMGKLIEDITARLEALKPSEEPSE